MRHPPAKPAPPENPLSAFTRFFRQLRRCGAGDGGRRPPAAGGGAAGCAAQPLRVQQLRLTFRAGDPAEAGELVAHGSRIFDQMMALLAQRGACTLQRAPARHQGGEALLAACVRPMRRSPGCACRKRRRGSSAFLADHLPCRRQAPGIYTVWLDETEHRQVQLAESELAQLLADAVPAYCPNTTTKGRSLL
jgi:hypothetical protein